MSVMEMSHRSKVYDNIIKEAEQDLRDLLNIPDNYKVLFLQGGASQFFADGSYEPDEKPQGRIYRNWSVGKESIPGSNNLRRGS